jgi:signal transduction histidine kinase
MSDPVWYRSIYWRIAFGFIAMLAVLLLTQGLLFLWLTDRIFGTAPRTPDQLARSVAEEVGTEFQQRPDGDLGAFVRDRFSHVYQPFLVVLTNGQRASNRPDSLPPEFGRQVQGRLRGEMFGGGGRFGEPGFRGPGGTSGSPPQIDPGRADAPAPRPQTGDGTTAPAIEPRGFPGGSGPGGAGPGGPGPGGFGRRGGPRFPTEYATIMAGDRQIGVVAVPSNPPPVSVALRELGPTLTWVGIGLLALGTTLTALFVFRPVHKRLRTLEHAARALGEGRTDVRATETGGDEVSSLARTFNRMAMDLESRAAALAASDRTRRQLLADVSHELMTPLSAIRGYVETLGMAELPIDQDTRQRYLDIVEQETHKLEAIIGDLLDLARLEGGGDRLRAEPVAVADLFRRISDRHEPSLRDRNVSLRTDIAQDTPPIRGDAGRLEQALQNLAANAIRHTPEGGSVTLAAAPADDGVRITVRDTGPGIPPEHLPRVFDRFYKVDAARAGTAVPSGSGLGLSIVRAIIERHGGTVAAENGIDGGALFELHLPAA